jgi:hypothetical protein
MQNRTPRSPGIMNEIAQLFPDVSLFSPIFSLTVTEDVKAIARVDRITGAGRRLWVSRTFGVPLGHLLIEVGLRHGLSRPESLTRSGARGAVSFAA